MNSQDPEIPKKLAGRLRASYSRVYSFRDKIAHSEAKGRDILLELEEYEANPESYAALHYPSVPDPLAYPTVTRIERLRDWLIYKTPKMPGYHEELLVAETLMADVEAEVLALLKNMRANTPGREPWPTKPQTLQMLRKYWEREYSRDRKRSGRYREKRQEKNRQDAERRLAERQQFALEMAESVHLKAMTMSPGRAAAYISTMEVLQERLLGDQMSLADFYDLVQVDSSVMKEIIAEAEAKTIQRLSNAAANAAQEDSES